MILQSGRENETASQTKSIKIEENVLKKTYNLGEKMKRQVKSKTPRKR